MTKKKKTIIAVSVLALVAVLCLVLFVPYETEKACPRCHGHARSECSMKKSAEYLSGVKQYNHDCSYCVNGYEICTYCDGEGYKKEYTTIFEELLSAI